MLQYLEKLQQEDLDELIKKRETQKQLMEDVSKANNVRITTTLYVNRFCGWLIIDQYGPFHNYGVNFSTKIHYPCLFKLVILQIIHYRLVL
jgi:hypothetical protein